MTSTNIAVVVRRGVTRATAFLDPALPLEAKLPQPVDAQREVENLMLLVGSECHDRLFNAVLRDGGSREKCPEPVLGRNAELAIAGGPEHDVIGGSAGAADPQAAWAMGHPTWSLLLREHWGHRAVRAGASQVQIQDPDK
jgi:hypothetical protein